MDGRLIRNQCFDWFLWASRFYALKADLKFTTLSYFLQELDFWNFWKAAPGFDGKFLQKDRLAQENPIF